MVIVKKHAIQRYQERVENVPANIAKQRLIKIAKCGSKQFIKKNGKNLNELEFHITYEGIEVLALKNPALKNLYIITCNGDTQLRKWYRDQSNQNKRLMRMVM